MGDSWIFIVTTFIFIIFWPLVEMVQWWITNVSSIDDGSRYTECGSCNYFFSKEDDVHHPACSDDSWMTVSKNLGRKKFLYHKSVKE